MSNSVWNGLQLLGGLSVSIWTNILAFVITQVVLTYRSSDILGNFYVLVILANGFPALMGILSIVMYDNRADSLKIARTFIWCRFGSITLNFISYGIISSRARAVVGPKITSASKQQVAINTLSSRMIYYPLVQSCGRISALVYQNLYGFGRYSGNTSTSQFICACMYYTTAPAVGIGYFIVFLIMQPQAMRHFHSLFWYCKPYHLQEKKEQGEDTFCRTANTTFNITCNEHNYNMQSPLHNTLSSSYNSNNNINVDGQFSKVDIINNTSSTTTVVDIEEQNRCNDDYNVVQDLYTQCSEMDDETLMQAIQHIPFDNIVSNTTTIHSNSVCSSKSGDAYQHDNSNLDRGNNNNNHNSDNNNNVYDYESSFTYSTRFSRDTFTNYVIERHSNDYNNEYRVEQSQQDIECICCTVAQDNSNVVLNANI